jgi:competence protein CoiA
MLCAVNNSGEKYMAFDFEVEELKLLANVNEGLFCPECNNPVMFKAGPKRISHFAHKIGTVCSYTYWEPESEQHIKGKMFIKEWLVSQYPNSRVELEYKVQETNQRSDVMVIHPTGEKWAFEYQCSPIPDYILNERHELYKNAGVKDYWIFGESVHHYWKTDGEIDYLKHKFIGMEIEALKFMKAAYYLDSSSGNFRMLYDFKAKTRHSETIYIIEEIIENLDRISPFQNYLVSSSSKEILMKYLKWQEELRLEKERERKEQEQRSAELEKRYRKEREQKRINLREYFNELKTEFNNMKNEMSDSEYKEFLRLCKKHRFNPDNFPGIFQVKVKDFNLIKTPRYLWQLWIYDNFIHQKKLKREKIWIPDVMDEFKKNVRSIFRLNPKLEDKHYSFAIYNYFELLSEINIVYQLSRRNNQMNSIQCDEIPIYEDRKVNTILAMALENEISISGIKEIELTYQKFLADIRTSVLEKHKQDSELLSKNNNIKELILEAAKISNSESTSLNTWERDFIKKMIGLSLKGVLYSEKQVGAINRILEKIKSE